MGGYGLGWSCLEQETMAAFCEFDLYKMREYFLDKLITVFTASQDTLRSILINW